jgi:hypothetical protein
MVEMKAVAEIESAITRLTSSEVDELAAWLDEYRAMTRASSDIFAMYDREEDAK